MSRLDLSAIVLTFLFWAIFVWLMSYRKWFWGSLKGNLIVCGSFAGLGILALYTVDNPAAISFFHLNKFMAAEKGRHVLTLLGFMFLVLSLSFRMVLQPNHEPRFRRFVSEHHVFPLSGTRHIIDNIRVREGDLVLLTHQRHATENGPWVVHRKQWVRDLRCPTGQHAFGSWVLTTSGEDRGRTLWLCELSRNDLVGQGDLVWSQVNAATKLRTFMSLQIPNSVGEAALFLLDSGVFPHQVRGGDRAYTVGHLRERGIISYTAEGILMNKTGTHGDSPDWGPRVRATMRLLIHSGEYSFNAHDYEGLLAAGLEHRLTAADFGADLTTRIQKEVTEDPLPPTRFERDAVV